MFKVRPGWKADGTDSIMGRLCARDGTGGASPVAADGNLLVAADLTSLAVAVWDVTASPAVRTYSASLTPGSVMFALATGGIYQPPNCSDSKGCNFLCDLPPAAFPTANHLYRAVVTATTTGGAIGYGVFEGPAIPTTPL